MRNAPALAIILVSMMQCIVLTLTLPWSVLNEEAELFRNCTLQPGFGFTQWGDICGMDLSELAHATMGKEFSIANALMDARPVSTVATALAAIAIPVHAQYGHRALGLHVMTFACMLVAVCSMISVSFYTSEQRDNMLVPSESVTVLGPGLWAEALTCAFSFAFVVYVLTSNQDMLLRTHQYPTRLRVFLTIVHIGLLFVCTAQWFAFEECSSKASFFDARACAGLGVGVRVALALPPVLSYALLWYASPKVNHANP